MASIGSETVELIDTAIERSQATTHGLIMSQFERLSASLRQPHGQPPQPPTPDSGPYSRSGRYTTRVYEPDPYIFDDEQPRHDHFDDTNLIVVAEVVDLCVRKDRPSPQILAFQSSKGTISIPCALLTMSSPTC
jgi:hypothetical protein